MRCFIKNFVSIALFIIFFSINTYAEVVKKIEISGNDRVSKETIIVFGDISVGKNYEISDVNNLIKKLYDTTLFSNISVNIKNNILNIVVKENPMINLVTIEGEKAKKYIDVITPLLKLREKTSFVGTFVKSDINIIKEFYRHLGFYFAKINLSVEPLNNNRVNLIYSID